MKAWVHKASNYSDGWVEEVNSLNDILKLADSVGIVLRKNDSYHAEPYPNRDMWEQDKKNGKLDCELDIIIYDDYLE